MLKFGEFLRSLPLPASFNIYKMDPMRGQSLLVVDSKLVFALVECFLGGSARTRFKIEGRDFTSIERRLIQKVVVMAFQDLEKAWAPVHQVKMNLVRVEINPMFVGVATPNDIMVISKFQIEMEQTEGFISVCMPMPPSSPSRASSIRDSRASSWSRTTAGLHGFRTSSATWKWKWRWNWPPPDAGQSDTGIGCRGRHFLQ